MPGKQLWNLRQLHFLISKVVVNCIYWNSFTCSVWASFTLRNIRVFMWMTHAAYPIRVNDLERGEGKELVERANSISSGGQSFDLWAQFPAETAAWSLNKSCLVWLMYAGDLLMELGTSRDEAVALHSFFSCAPAFLISKRSFTRLHQPLFKLKIWQPAPDRLFPEPRIS